MNSLRKGSRWRKACQDWLISAGWTTRFRGIGDAGDDITATIPGLELSVECKDHQRLELAAWVDQARRQAPPGSVPVVMVHRRGRANVGDAYVVLSGYAFNQLVTKLRR